MMTDSFIPSELYVLGTVMRDVLKSRRRVLLGLGTGATVGLAGCLNGDEEPEEPDEPEETDDVDDSDDEETSDDEESEMTTFERQVDELREAVDQYTDPDAAIADGYRFTGPYVPGMGYHFVNFDSIDERNEEESFDHTEPQILVYQVNENGELELGAAEFAIHEDVMSEPGDIFDVSEEDDVVTSEEDGWQPVGEGSLVLAVPDDDESRADDFTAEEMNNNDYWAKVTPEYDGEPGDSVSLDWGVPQEAPEDGEERGEERVVNEVHYHPTLNALHVWTHKENPDGVLSPTHPDVTVEDVENGE